MNKRYIQGVSLLACLASLTGCIENVGPKDDQAEVKPNQATVNTTNHQLAADLYRAVIIDGKYQLGASASSTNTPASVGNAKAFEEGLMRISKSVFPPDQYYLQEGQLIDSETLTAWLGRESEDNPEGLNPALAEGEETTTSEEETTMTEMTSEETTLEESTESGDNNQVSVDNQTTPLFLNQILEKNIMVETEDGFALSGIVIGLAMNSTYSYTDDQGVVHEQEISMGEMRERGKQYANIIVGRLRNTEELRSIPILVGLYRDAPNSDVVGGTFILDGISREGNAVADWTEHNEYRVLLPILDPEQQSERYTYFDSFRNRVLDFFPNLNGISGQAFYVDDTLKSLDIEIVTQFYQNTQVAALAQHVSDVVQDELPENIDLEIRIESVDGIQAFISRSADKNQIQSHVFH